ncbi:MAG: hypothetical protein RI993_903 [Pseudomonadota bacterium]|jgi:CPA2 family monovalent cation:H+ antiporter-2
MPHNTILITTIAISLGLALLLGMVAHRLKLPVLVGYLAAGIIIGPATPGFVIDLELSSQLAEIGVILLMFGVGLHFSLNDLLAVRKIAIPGAILQILVATILGAIVATSWEWSLGGGIVFGLALSVASTVVLLRALEHRGLLKSINGKIAIGWLIVEDLVVVLALVLLPVLSAWFATDADSASITGSGGLDLFIALFIILSKVSIFIGFMLVIGKRIFPKLLWYVASTKSQELFILCVVSVAVGIAYGATILFDVSLALGAFFSGMVMRESPLSHRAARESLPLRDAFSVLFFVSIGMLFDPNILMNEPLKLVIVVMIIIFGKSMIALLLILALRYPLNTALTVSVSLAQIGELSFILASLGHSLGLLPSDGYSLILAGALVTITLNPLVFRTAEPIQNWIRSRSRLARFVERPNDPLAELPVAVSSKVVTNHVIVVGFGSTGERISALLTNQAIPFVVIDPNRELIEQLRGEGIHAVAGNASEPAVLIQAHIARSAVLVITVSDPIAVRQMVEVSRILNPHNEILISTFNKEEAAILQQEQTGTIFLGERVLAENVVAQVTRSLQEHKNTNNA